MSASIILSWLFASSAEVASSVKHNDVRVVQEQTRKSEAPDDFVSELASDDCASELSLALEFLADDFALPIT